LEISSRKAPQIHYIWICDNQIRLRKGLQYQCHIQSNRMKEQTGRSAGGFSQWAMAGCSWNSNQELSCVLGFL
jgi:hypothetical protein